MKIKSVLLVFFAVIIAVMALVPRANAQEVISQDNLTIAKNQTIDSALVANGSTINIEGNVEGDLYCVGSQVVISGRINGDVFCMAQSISVSGRVSGSLRLISSDINISGFVGNDALLVAQNFILTDKSSIGRDLTFSSTGSRVNGSVGRDLTAMAQFLELGGYVGRNVSGRIMKLTINSTADIRGDIRYTGNDDALRLSGSKVSGGIVRTPIAPMPAYGGGILNLALGYLGFVASLLIVSMASIWALPKFFTATNKEIDSSVVKTSSISIIKKVALSLLAIIIGLPLAIIIPSPYLSVLIMLITIGIVLYIFFGKVTLFGWANLLLVPPVLIILTITLVGIPLAGLVAVAWVLGLILCGPVAAFYVGTKILKGKKSGKNEYLVMLVGSVVVLALYLVPVINLLVGLAVGVVGSGAIMAHFKHLNARPKKS
jgi:cytoskeletal protein CcmA (bactofilin family)